MPHTLRIGARIGSADSFWVQTRQTVQQHAQPQLAALNRTNINVQELIVHAALTGDSDAIHHVVMLYPLAAAVCTLPQIHAMVDELFAAQRRWLPQF